jgi:hypothetical protein
MGYWLIEDLEQIRVFQNSGYKEAFIEVIPYNDNIHPTKNNVSLVYIRPLLASKGYMVCVNHSEGLNVEESVIDTLLKKFEILYTRDKKEMLHYFPLKALIDINLSPNPYIRPSTITHDIFYGRHKDNKDINRVIPIVKHYELCEQIYSDLLPKMGLEPTKYSKFFNSKVSLAFNYVEKSGMKVDPKIFENYFHEVEGEYVYNEFHLKSLTTRPSNTFNGVNYLALNKKDGCRKAFIPRNDFLWEIDISAYHPTLASFLIGYKFPTNDIHSHLAEMYGVSYDESKLLTFQQLYGGVFKKYEDIEFFKRIKEYQAITLNNYDNVGEVIVPVSSYCLKKGELGEMVAPKLFNYILQCLETSVNTLILMDIIRLLIGKKTKIILYTYDSFMFDIDEEENLIEQIKQIFTKYKLNTKEKQGNDYSFATTK